MTTTAPATANEMLPAMAALIPTYRRTDDLARCLDACLEQDYPFHEIVVIARSDDDATWEYLRGRPVSDVPIRTVAVELPGQVHAINSGLGAVTAPIVAITDDDAAPHADWSLRIARAFAAHPGVAAVGGRDVVHLGDHIIVGAKPIVGIIPKVGRLIGNHHIGVGPPRFVDSVKGVNGSYRTSEIRAVGLDTRLRGTGAQVYWEVGVAFGLKKAGWKLLYDPAIVVEHYVAKRFDEDQRNTFNALAVKNASYNQALLRLESLRGVERYRYAAWSILIGTTAHPGFVQTVRYVLRRQTFYVAKTRSSVSGFLDAWRDARPQGAV